MYLEHLLGSDTRVKILRTLFQEAFPSMDAAALAKETGKSLAGTHLALMRLTAARIIQAHSRGRTRYYGVNSDHGWSASLLELFQEEKRKVNVPHLFPTYWNHLEPIVNALAKQRGVEAVVLFGSLTRPPIFPDADVDLLVVLQDPSVRPFAGRMVLGHKVSLLPLTRDALSDKVRRNDPFTTGALERHVVLFQAPDFEFPWTKERTRIPIKGRRFRRGGFR